jgi:hypothetical protein
MMLAGKDACWFEVLILSDQERRPEGFLMKLVEIDIGIL